MLSWRSFAATPREQVLYPLDAPGNAARGANAALLQLTRHAAQAFLLQFARDRGNPGSEAVRLCNSCGDDLGRVWHWPAPEPAQADASCLGSRQGCLRALGDQAGFEFSYGGHLRHHELSDRTGGECREVAEYHTARPGTVHDIQEKASALVAELGRTTTST